MFNRKARRRRFENNDDNNDQQQQLSKKSPYLLLKGTESGQLVEMSTVLITFLKTQLEQSMKIQLNEIKL